MEGIKLTIDNVSVDFSNMDKILTLLLQSSNKELKISGDSCLTPEKVVTANSKKEKSPKRTPLSNRKISSNQGLAISSPNGLSPKKAGIGAKLFPGDSITDKENHPLSSSPLSRSVLEHGGTSRSITNGNDAVPKVAPKSATKPKATEVVPAEAEPQVTSFGGRRNETCMQKRSRNRVVDGALLLRKAQAMKKSQQETANLKTVVMEKPKAGDVAPASPATLAAEASTSAWESEVARQQAMIVIPTAVATTTPAASAPADPLSPPPATIAIAAASDTGAERPADSDVDAPNTDGSSSDCETVSRLTDRLADMQHRVRSSDGEIRLLRFSVQKLKTQLEGGAGVFPVAPVAAVESVPEVADAATETVAVPEAAVVEGRSTVIDLSDWLVFFIKHRKLIKQMGLSDAEVEGAEVGRELSGGATLKKLATRSTVQSPAVSSPATPSPVSALAPVSTSDSGLLDYSRLHRSLCSPQGGRLPASPYPTVSQASSPAPASLLSAAQEHTPVPATVLSAAREHTPALAREDNHKPQHECVCMPDTSIDSCDQLEFVSMQDMLLGFSTTSTPASAPRSTQNTAPSSAVSAGYSPMFGDLAMSEQKASAVAVGVSTLPPSGKRSSQYLTASSAATANNDAASKISLNSSSQRSATRSSSPCVRLGGYASISGALHTTTGSAEATSPPSEDYTQDIFRYFQASPAPILPPAADHVSEETTPITMITSVQENLNNAVSGDVQQHVGVAQCLPSATPRTLRSAWKTWATLGGRERAERPEYDATIDRLRHFNSPVPPVSRAAPTATAETGTSVLSADKYRDIVYKTAKGETLPILSPDTYREVVGKLRNENALIQADIALFRANLSVSIACLSVGLSARLFV